MASTNAGTHTVAAAATRASVNSIQPQLIPVPIRSPLPNNSPIGSNFSTAGESPIATASDLGHPNSDSDSDPSAIALIRAWRLSQRGRTHERGAASIPLEQLATERLVGRGRKDYSEFCRFLDRMSLLFVPSHASR